MTGDFKQVLAHVLWLGGATDAGKTMVAQLLSDQHHLQVYNYDRYDFAHHYHLAQTVLAYRQMLNASLDEMWVRPTPELLMKRAIQSFHDRFPLVIGDLCSLPQQPLIIAEGFGLTPELVAPLLSNSWQGVWMIPTPEFKQASMARRNKPSFRDQTSNPELAWRNLYERDILLAAHLKTEAQSRGLTVYIIDGSQSTEEIAHHIERQFFHNGM